VALEVKKGVGVVGMASSRSHPVLPGDDGMVMVIDKGDVTVRARSLAARGGEVYMIEALLLLQGVLVSYRRGVLFCYLSVCRGQRAGRRHALIRNFVCSSWASRVKR